MEKLLEPCVFTDIAKITDVILQITKDGAVMPDNAYISAAIELSTTETVG